MLSATVLDKLNQQINQEFRSAYYYLAMCAWCDLHDFSGASSFLRLQYEEELAHAMKLFDYVVSRQTGQVQLLPISEPNMKFDSLHDVFQAALRNEKQTTAGIYEVMDLAHKEHDYATQTLLNWFAEEQAEEESNMEHYVNRLAMVGDNGPGLLLIDQELSKRQKPATTDTGDKK